ncbi:unnamed protein product [Closterium sp. Naga37s-1]|nr:unnamed protein product [Closterium sp. Naga37s-1]
MSLRRRVPLPRLLLLALSASLLLLLLAPRLPAAASAALAASAQGSASAQGAAASAQDDAAPTAPPPTESLYAIAMSALRAKSLMESSAGTSAGILDNPSPTKAQFVAELKALVKRLNARGCSIFGKVVRTFLSSAEKTADADFVYAPLTFLAPTDAAFFRALFRSRHSMSRKVALFHILVDLYSLKKLKAVPDRNGLFPLLFFSSLGSSSDKYVLVKHSVRPNLIFNPGTKVAFSAWNASTLFWAQVDTRRLFEGSFVKAHQLDRVLLP